MSESLPVLVVDDEEVLLCFLNTALERGGIKVVGATSGAELSNRFLFVTGNVSDDYAVEIRERTGALFIEKPFRIALLIELIKKITSRNE